MSSVRFQLNNTTGVIINRSLCNVRYFPRYIHRCDILADQKKNYYIFGKKTSNELICVTTRQGICDEREILTCVNSQL